MTVKAWLEGRDFDLQELVDLFPTGGTRVVKDLDSYYLTSAEIDNRPPGVSFYEIAPRVLRCINGSARMANANFCPVTLNGQYRDGETNHTAAQAGTAEGWGRAFGTAQNTGGHGEVESRPGRLGPPPVSFADVNPDVAEARSIMGQPAPLGWVEMYKIYEIIKANLDPCRIEDLGFTAKEIRTFKASANRPDLSGTEARHARMAGGPPHDSMSLVDGRAYISQLALAWVDHLT